eukprot:6534460-Pyramimonas_sp.AAC.1
MEGETRRDSATTLTARCRLWSRRRIGRTGLSQRVRAMPRELATICVQLRCHTEDLFTAS